MPVRIPLCFSCNDSIDPNDYFLCILKGSLEYLGSLQMVGPHSHHIYFTTCRVNVSGMCNENSFIWGTMGVLSWRESMLIIQNGAEMDLA